ncbi:phage holin family protein [Qipengyuania sp. ASV99]|uniref:phage holin family protein n=1 Tax=Qipengyuania sp. ASV99 TaxID=3399681 RepID=UPI003A4C6251
MDNIDRQTGAAHPGNAAPDAENAVPPANNEPDDSLIGEIAALIDGGRTYAQAEIGFQKTRAKLAGRNLGTVLLCIILALILVHIALLALAVGLVIALAPLVSIWGAIAIVVGGLLLVVAVLTLIAKKRVQRLSTLFASDQNEADA